MTFFGVTPDQIAMEKLFPLRETLSEGFARPPKKRIGVINRTIRVLYTFRCILEWNSID